ncbi:TPA: RHS repeat domain-containing protein, partial [Elizabethkingia anophelis]
QSDGTLRRYSYQYDGVNRLKEGNYWDNAGAISGSYAERLNYDVNGNITGLQRTGQGAGLMDQLSYTYDQSGNSNKLIRVNDASGNATGYPVGGNTILYDINGNMVNHLDKGISNIAYNYLNLPSSITASIGNTDYVYRADGSKVKKVFGGKTTDYLDGFQYENGVLQFVPTSEGYYDVVKNKYIYNYTDHLGNVRLSYTKGAAGGAEIIEENNYYPFGLKHQGYNSSSLANNAYQYKYNGKELQETGMYDYGARMYMPELGRWGVVDPLSESSRRWSPYNYVLNNPIMFIDPDGRSVTENAFGVTYTEEDAKDAFITFRNSITNKENNGPGPKGSWGGVQWQKYINNWAYEDGVENYNINVRARVGTLTSINGNAKLNVKQTTGQWDKEYGYLSTDRANFLNKNAQFITNCYGYVLTNGYFFVDDSVENIRNFLLDSGYKSSQASNKTNFKKGDILLWEGHIIEATSSKNGRVTWDSYFSFDSTPVKGSLQQIMNYNKEVSGGGYGTLQGATLYRQQDQSKIKFGQKKYETVDVKTIQKQRQNIPY